MFQLDSAFATELLALIAAAALLAWTGYAPVHAKKLVRAISYTGIVIALLGMLCTFYYGLKYTRMGYFKTPVGMMMQHGMMGCGMMKEGMMKDGMMPPSETAPEDNATPEEPAHSGPATNSSSSKNYPHLH